MPELRKDPITGRWVIISTERGKRPNDFVRESVWCQAAVGTARSALEAKQDAAGNSGVWAKWRRGEHVRMEHSRGAEPLSSAGH